MTIIDTLDRLSELEPGTKITVGRAGERTYYTRVEGGFTRDNIENSPCLEPDWFRGAMSEGVVNQGEPRPVRTGDLYADTSGAYHYYVGPQVQGRGGEPWFHVAQFYRRQFDYLGSYGAATFNDSDTTHLVDEAPEWFAPFAQMARSLTAQASTLHARELELVQARAAAGSMAVHTGLVEALQSVATNWEDYDQDDFETLLDEHGIPVERDHEIDVRIYGTVDVNQRWMTEMTGLNYDDIDDYPSGDLEFSRHTTITKRGVGCRCDDVSRDDLFAATEDLRVEWDFQVECHSS